MARFIIFPTLQCIKCFDSYTGIINSEENRILYSHDYPYSDYNSPSKLKACEDVGKEFNFSISEFYRDIS